MDEEDEEGSEGEIEPEYSGMEQPPLTRMLKNILSEYPDDGQILKELIQNAEDAGASEVKIVFDDRCINQEACNEKKKPFNKYFKGPALFFTNNAVFSDSDWRGIKMLYSSVKELDPLKVGRFGLGFKSVFHITDYPMIISGKKLLVINPYTTYTDKVCTSFLLKGLSRYKGMDMNAFSDAFDDIFGFGEETLSSGEYKGTLFRFPLRQVGTELSGNLYDAEKIETLFDSFKTEAPMTLLFLKRLEEMTLYRKNHGVEPIYRVKIEGKGSEKLLEKRKKFCQDLQEYDRSNMSHDLTFSLHVNVSVKTSGQYGLQENNSWFIVNKVLGGSHMSTQFRALSQDKDLSYSPYVGIAIPYKDIADFKGHVFCFLPLPLEERSLTGLPVHLNGFFALSQNRRHVKWPSADLKQSAISADKSLQWNQVMIKEALSNVYLTVVQDLITKCSGENNPVELVAMVYRSIPHLHEVDVKWRGILDPLLNSLMQTSFLYTENNGGQWIQPKDAVFECPDYNNDTKVRDTLRLIMKQYKMNLVIIPPHITALLQEKTNMTVLSPSFLRNLLRQNNVYENCKWNQKLHLLQFLMSDEQYFSLGSLKLLPLENGKFTTFENYGCVYMCGESTMKLIPGCEELTVKQDLPHVIKQHLQTIAKKGMFQVQALNNLGFVRLLKLCMDRNLTDNGQFKVWDTKKSSLPVDWLEKVWSKLKAISSLEHFKDLELVPTKHGKDYHLYKLKGLFIVKSYNSHVLPDAICRSMAHFSVIVLPDLPRFMAEHSEVTNYIHIPVQDSFLRLLDRLYTNNYAYLQSFNTNAGNEERSSWMKYLEHLNIRKSYGEMPLGQMKIFKELGNSGYTSISEVDTLAPQLGCDFPVKYPRRLLSSTDSCQCKVAQNLGATQLTEVAAIEIILREKWHTYSDMDKKKLMKYFIRKIHQFKRNYDLMELAKNAEFVPTSTRGLKKPSELYDPTIKRLKELIGDDSMFPEGQFSSPEILVGLRDLGLKSSSPPCKLIYSCIDELDRKVRQGQLSNLKQAEAVNHFLSQQSGQLDFDLLDKRFLVPQKRTSVYPTSLPWYHNTHELCSPGECILATTRNQRIVGSVIPLVSENAYNYLKDTFQLLHPQITDVLNHFLQIQRSYKVNYKPDMLQCISEVYSFLADNVSTSWVIKGEIQDFFSKEPLVWAEEMFVKVTDVYTTSNPGDIRLDPYMYCLPREFQSFKQFFEVIGCHDKQTVDVLHTVQEKIKVKHDGQTCASSNDVDKDLNITVQILTKYKQDPKSVSHLDVLFPVHTGSDTRLQLMYASECRYSNEEWLKSMAEEEEETIHYVHADIPSHTAHTLGVRSLTEGLLSDTEAIEPCGQHEDLTGRIKGLLDGYTDGLSVPKEIVQNADDAGATKVCFLYDERENMDARTRLIDENMSSFQGAAFWAYNDAQFTKADLNNITKLGGATKQEDDTKIGKFGLGFCSVYNLTDVPSFITGTDLVIFDPHYRNLGSAVKGKEPGLKINLKSLQNQRLVRRMKNQFKPFNKVFGCDMTMGGDFHSYDGTLFRLPLRTNEHAGKSQIKDSAYSKSDIKELLHMLMENGGNMLLFTQNVTKIEVYYLPADATDPSQSTRIYTATKNMRDCDFQNIQVAGTFNILKEVSALYSSVQHRQKHVPEVKKTIKTEINIQVENAAKCFISCTVSEMQSSTQWVITYATGSSKSLEISKQVKGVLPLAGVATPVQINGCVVKLTSLGNMPFGFYKTGHYFSFLPLPIQTGLPLHINATFAVAPDRRSIMWGTEDDKTIFFKPRWNHSLMIDAVPKAYVCLLESLQTFSGIIDEDYINIWPTGIYPASSKELQHLQRAFLTTIVEENHRVFKRCDIWANYEDCRFVDPELLESEVGDIAFEAAIHFLESVGDKSTKVMKLQKNLDASFRNAGLGSTIKTKIFSTENFFTEVLFPEMLSDFWQSRERNMLVMFAVDNMIETTKTLLQSTKCIPVEPTGELKCPRDLIHPESELKNLFTTCEGRFVHKEMIDIGIKQRKKQMEDIGMIVETLPPQLVVDRVKSVLVLSQACDMCALERSFTIIKYIGRKCMQDKMLIEQLKDIPYLPVLKKPKDWSFLWGADRQSSDTDLTTMKDVKVTNCNHNVKESVQFARPRCLYLTSTQHLVGSQELVMDKSYCESLLFREIFSKLGVNGGNVDTIPIKVVCRHLIELCENTDLVKMTEDSKHLLKKVCNEVYTFLNKRIINETISDEEIINIKDLKEHPIVFCHNIFVKPKQTALNILVDCEPHLFGLLGHHLESKCKQLLHVLDIKTQFTSDDILNVMLERQTYRGAKHLTEDELELYTKLIKVLVRCMQQENIDYHRICTITDKEGVSTQLCIPDVEGVLTPIKFMCLNDNEKIKTTGTMKFVNGKIGPDFARTLGVKAKTKQHFSDNTRKIPFGQKEELTTRIKEILRDYPCDEGIMKELLQNADDAQATELQFIIDDNTYSTERVFDDRWKTLQGPALLVYNDSMFSNKDIQGIQNLGIGSKGDDPTKTGQYGVGFNAVYHLTDAPSFLSKGPNVEEGETMCVMDPYCQYLPDATEERPGIQLLNLDEHRNIHPDVFTCYHEDKLLTDKGTVFRFPLRSDDETRKHLAASMSSKKLRNLFKTFEGELLETLLFVNSVKKISLSDFSDGELKPLYEVEIVISEEDEGKRIAFGNHLKDLNKKYNDTQDPSSIQNESVSYNITVKDSHGVSNTWLVVQQIGFGEGGIPEEVLNAYKNGSIGLLPRGGVAIHLASHTSSEQRQKTFCHTSKTSSKQKCKAFCFLPLPIDTGLPVHVNGHFALGGETRSSLWTEERRTYRWEWNKLLLSKVIPSAYITGMQRMKQMLLSDFGKSGLVKTTKQLDDVFPIYKNAKDDNWKLLAKEVLTQIYNDGHQLFYLYESHRNSDTLKIPPVFMALKDPKETFPAVFNTLEDHKKKTTETWKNRQLLTQVMKDIGLRLLDSPSKILRSMKDAEVPASDISPETIIEFTKSFSRKDIEHKCNILIQEDGTHLSNTNLQNMGNILALLHYCRDSEDFASGIVDVPLCLTQDGKLRVFKEDSEIFCSEQLFILPGSGNRFLHSSLVWLCNIEKLQEKVFKSFDIPTFAKYLAESLPPEVFMKPKEMVTFLPDNKQIPNSLWIGNVWKFFEGCLKKSKGKVEAIKGKDEANKTSPDDNKAIQTIPKDLQVVAHWNLVPCTLFETTQRYETERKVLSSLSNFDKVLNLESFTGNLKNALEILAVPVFATDLLDSSVLLSLIPNHKRPVMVLNCLYLNRNQSRYQSLSKTNSDAILEYFVDHIKDVQKLDDWKTKIKSLPLHCTVHGVLVSLEIERKVLVLPAHIPPEGIKEWGHYSRTLLLKQNPKLKPLYDAFEYTESHLCDVYSNHILASIDGLPKDCIPVHLEYIRENLLQSYDNIYNTHQSNLIAALKELRIFETAVGGLKRASELYSPHVRLFLAMCNIFPVAPYDEWKWKSFMELIGMVAKASNDLIIQFAHQIEAEGRYTITERVLEKSEYLLEYIWDIDNVAVRGLLPKIRTIKFIVPSKLSGKQETIYPQYEAGQLMAFEGAVPDLYTKYVWSSCNILPEMANPFLGFNKKKTDAVARQLQVCLEKPPLEKVILHTQNICDALKEQCEKKIWQNKDEYLKRLMSDIYQHLWENGAKQDILYSHLHQKPIVYLPSENKFVTCVVLVIRLEEEQEIKPYLYSAPLEFGRNFDLFEKLGTEKRPTCAVYARVLERVKCDVMDHELNANERQSVLKAIDGLFSHLRMPNNTDVNLQVPVLYLPTEDYKLMDSTKMIYSNNQQFHNAIGKDAGLPYFVGFRALELCFLETDIEKLPAKCRPRILTKMVEERIDISNRKVTQGYYTNQLQEFIQRPEFVEGLLRISHHDRYESFMQGTGNVDESDVVSGLQKVKVLQVEDLTVEYIYNGRVVGSSTDVFCHIHKEGNDQESIAWYFYTKVPEGIDKALWLRKIEKKLIKLIKKSTKIDCFHHGSLMLNILMEIDHPERISVILDQEHYREYRLHESLLNTFLPPCGTYVHEKWHHMLDNTTFTFDNDEYVALQLHDDEVMDSDASTEESDLYIYAKIMKRIGCDIEGDLSPELTKYEVLVGEGRFIIKYAYEMYKILRKKTDSREIVQAVDIGNQSPTNTLPLQVIYKEVRRKLLAIWNLPDREKRAIFKRYLRQWHPDKNIGNEAQAKDVFQYIMNIWDRLTNGDHVSVDDDDVDTSDFSQSRPSPNSQFYENVSRQCSRERERYQESTSSTSRGGYRRSCFRDNDPVSNPMQQRKWFKQAELDLVAAEHFMKSIEDEEVRAYNWICYMSHQAVEKSLKSMMYRGDANSVLKGHHICRIAKSLCDDSLISATLEMHSLLGNHTHMRYPDVHANGRIPSSIFTRAMAEKALEIARRVLDKVRMKRVDTA